MACTVTHTFTSPADAAIATTKAKITAAGGSLTESTATSGSLSVPVPVMGSISGTYDVNGQVMTVNITSKPFLISCGQIQNYVDNNF